MNRPRRAMRAHPQQSFLQGYLRAISVPNIGDGACMTTCGGSSPRPPSNLQKNRNHKHHPLVAGGHRPAAASTEQRGGLGRTYEGKAMPSAQPRRAESPVAPFSWSTAFVPSAGRDHGGLTTAHRQPPAATHIGGRTSRRRGPNPSVLLLPSVCGGARPQLAVGGQTAEDTMRRRIYISGPLTSSGNVTENLDRAMAAARGAIDAGFAPFCPHLTYHVDPGGEYPHGLWMEIELPWVTVADALLRLPGESLGADLEVQRAEEIGIPVFKTIADLINHFRGRQCGRVASRMRGTHSQGIKCRSRSR